MNSIILLVYVFGAAETAYAIGYRCSNSRKDCTILARKGWCRRQTISNSCQLSCGICKKKYAEKSISISNESSKHLKRPKTLSLNCGDKMVGCHVLSKRGWCKHRQDQMIIKCRKTCGFCDLKSKARKHSKSLVVPLGACVDKSKACNMMKTRGWCKHRKGHMQSKCRKTCNFCGTCEDQRQDCNGLKRVGFCEKRPDKMIKMCKKTCGLCSNTETNEVEITPPEPNGGCVDTFGQKRCEYYAHIGMCTKNPQFKKICHNTCVCSFKKTTNPRHCKSSEHGCCWDNKTTKRDLFGSDCPVCKDDPRFEVLCTRFGEDCKGSGGLAQSVRKHCPKTCNHC